ncbi:hypothetical protein HGRIS_005865 [Hohenbuehelia grisea]|uniref:C2H2-type domain-containing protein n=1 Tax=Hohenbuehelia grisea TaxID=104357 RepID=A0ABR3JZ06_9AGAR
MVLDSGSCPYCQYIAVSVSDWDHHIRSHVSRANNGKHSCPSIGCPFQDRLKSIVARHHRKHYGYSKLVQCPDCTFATENPNSLSRHRYKAHGYVYMGSNIARWKTTRIARSQGHQFAQPNPLNGPAASSPGPTEPGAHEEDMQLEAEILAAMASLDFNGTPAMSDE